MTGFESNSPVASYLSHFRRYYPGILEWYSGLKEELLSGRRSMFVSSNASEVQGLAITKNGPSGKLCHISVSPAVRDRGLGRTLMSLALSDMARRGAREIHVTTGEEVFRDHAEFFRASGFSLVDWQLNRYRKGTSELIWKMTADSEPMCPELPALNDIGHPPAFRGEASSCSSNIRALTSLRSAFERRFSKLTWNALDEASSTSLSAACRASLPCSALFSLGTRFHFFERRWLLPSSIVADNSSPSLPDLAYLTNSHLVES